MLFLDVPINGGGIVIALSITCEEDSVVRPSLNWGTLERSLIFRLSVLIISEIVISISGSCSLWLFLSSIRIRLDPLECVSRNERMPK